MRRLPRGLLLAYAAFVLVVTWWPSPQSTSAPQWEQHILAWVRDMGIPITMPALEAVANIGMFVPLGALVVPTLPPQSQRARTVLVVATGAGACFSTTIELVQLGIPGRFATLQDVLMNTIGAAVGAGLVVGIRRLSSPGT